VLVKVFVVVGVGRVTVTVGLKLGEAERVGVTP